MGKTLGERKMNRKIKTFNKQLKRDVFGNRFWIREYRKSRIDGITYFLFELKDREQPERDCLIHGWINEFADWKIFTEMNDFIINSDFWEKYREQK